MKQNKIVKYTVQAKEGDQYKKVFCYTAFDAAQEEYVLSRIALFYTKIDKVSLTTRNEFLYLCFQFIMKGQSLLVEGEFDVLHRILTTGRNKVRFVLEVPDLSTVEHRVDKTVQFGQTISHRRAERIDDMLIKHSINPEEFFNAILEAEPNHKVKLNKRERRTVMDILHTSMSKDMSNLERAVKRLQEVVKVQEQEINDLYVRIEGNSKSSNVSSLSDKVKKKLAE